MEKKIIEENVTAYYNDYKYVDYYNKIAEKDFKLIKILKDDQRSYVSLVEIDGEKIVYKEPREKNSNSWQRFLSIFRGGESRREFENSSRILENGFLGAEPLLAIEEIRGRKCIFSFFLMRYIEAHHAVLRDLKNVERELQKIHEKGFLHGDSQLPNFMIKENLTYLIDCKFSKNYWGILGKMAEFLYLEKSCHSDVKLKYGDTILFKIFKKFDYTYEKLNSIRKKMKKKLRGG